MNDATRSIFRDTALQRYIDDRERSVLPRFISPRTFLALWLLLALLGAAGLIAWFARVPVYASGPAVVVEGRDSGRHTPAGAVLVAFLPAELLPRLHAGQTTFLALDGSGTRVRRPILSVEPAVSSPSAVRRRFAADTATAAAITRPVAVVTIDPEPLPSGLPAAAHAGIVLQVDVAIGSRRLLSFVPLVGAVVGG